MTSRCSYAANAPPYTAQPLLIRLDNTGTEWEEVVAQSTAQRVLVDLIRETASFPEKLAKENIYFCCRRKVSLVKKINHKN